MKKYPNHPSQPFELPIPFTPLAPPSDAYREGWERIFGGKDKPDVVEISTKKHGELIGDTEDA